MIPTTINPPMDNMWKFYAIFGLVLLIASVAMPARMFGQLNTNIHAFNVDLAELRAEMQGMAGNADVVPVDLRVKVARMTATRQVLQFSRNEIEQLGAFAGWIVVLGGCLATFGFWKWYLHQQVADRLLSQQLQSGR